MEYSNAIANVLDIGQQVGAQDDRLATLLQVDN